MRDAENLRELLLIRHENRKYIDKINGNLGSALGFKRKKGQPLESGDPAIIIFVPRKIHDKWLPKEQKIPKTMEHAELDISCPIDVVEGGKYEEIQLRYRVGEKGKFDKHITRTELLGSPPLTHAENTLLEILHGASKKVVPGSLLFFKEGGDDGYNGTLACFARSKGGDLGFLTNHHVAYKRGNTLWYATEGTRVTGTVIDLKEDVDFGTRFRDEQLNELDGLKAQYAVDCAFVKFDDGVRKNDLDPYLNLVTEAGRVQRKKMGEPLELRLDTMGPIGKNVVSVGSTRSMQRGQIVSFAYEWSEGGKGWFTDYLIANAPDKQFHDFGDSGKLIVTDDDNHNPVALFWGGQMERLRRGAMQEMWSYGIDIGLVLKTLDIELIRSF